MTRPADVDLLDLAEAVAAGDLRATDAETQARSEFGRSDDRAATEAALDLRELTMAIDAVRAHARATHAAAFATVDGDAGAVQVDTPVGAGPVRRRRGDRGAGRAGRPTWLLAAAALLVPIALFGIALGGGLSVPPSPTPRPAAVEATASAAAPTNSPPAATTAPASLDPSATDLAPPSIEPVPGQPVLLRDENAISIHFVSNGVGWAYSTSSVHRTTDGGKSWTDVHPPFHSTLPGTRFLDGDTAYVASHEPAGRIAVTHDGGLTWQTTTIADPTIADSTKFAFRTPEVGTASFADDDGRTNHVYRTSDGGRTWVGPVYNSIPAGMEEARGIYGPDTGVLWSSNAQADGQPFDDRLAFSIDGGATWQDTRFPIDTHGPAGVLKWVTEIRADSTGHVVLALDTGDFSGIYVSEDFGRRWTFIKETSGRMVRLLSATDWLLLSEDPMGSESTTDGGLTWRTVAGGPRIHFDAVSISSPQDMWAVHDCDRMAGPWFPGPDPYCDGRAAKEVLLVTHDGAKTWQEVGG